MIIFKLITAWLFIGCLVQVLMMLRLRKAAHDHGAKFRIEFDLNWVKWTLVDVIRWPYFIIMIDNLLDQIKEAHKNKRSS